MPDPISERAADPSPEAMKAGDELRKRLDLILVAIAIRTDLSAKDRETLIINAKRRENALALDAFRREGVEKERERIRAAIFVIRDKDKRSLDWCNALNEAMNWTRGGQP